jgi:hypothetical protein
MPVQRAILWKVPVPNAGFGAPSTVEMLKWTEQDLADAGAERLPLGRPTEEWSYSDLDAGFKGAVLVLDETFVVQSTGHHPMETRSAMASWQNGKLYLYGSTQSVAQTRAAIAQWVGIDAGDVVLICEYTGGVFPPHLLERTQGRRVRRHQHLPNRTTDRRRGRRSDNEAEGADRLADCLSGRHNRPRYRLKPAIRSCLVSATSGPDRPNASRPWSGKVRPPFAPSTIT